jgi:hypothetical protein
MKKATQKLLTMRDWVLANPNKKAADFIRETGGTRIQFHNFRYNHITKKKHKPVVSEQRVSVMPEFDIVRKKMNDVYTLLSEVQSLAKILADTAGKATNLINSHATSV